MDIDPGTQRKIDTLEEEIKAIQRTYDPNESWRKQDEKQFEIYWIQNEIDTLKGRYDF